MPIDVNNILSDAEKRKAMMAPQQTVNPQPVLPQQTVKPQPVSTQTPSAPTSTGINVNQILNDANIMKQQTQTAAPKQTVLPSAQKTTESAVKQKLDALMRDGQTGKQESPTNNKNLNALLYGTERAAAGLLGFGEGITDFLGGSFYKGLEGITSLGGLLPNKVSDYAGKLAEGFVDNSITRDYEQSIKERYNPTQMQETATGIGQSVNNMLASIALGQAGGAAAEALSGAGKLTDAAKKAQTAANVGKAAMGLSAAGGAAREAYEEGATTGQALAYGAASGTLETVIESLAGGIPGLGEGKLSQIVEKVISNPVVAKTLDIAGEGAEEAASTIIAPFIKRAIYDKDAETASAEEIAQSAITGMITSGVLQLGIELPQAIGNRADRRALPQKTTAVRETDVSDTQSAVTPTAEADTETEIGFMGPEVDTESAKKPMQNASGGVKIKSADVDTSILSDFNAARRKFISYAKQFFPNKVTINSNGKSVDIARNGLDKLLSGDIKREKYISAFKTPQLIENGIKVGEATNLKEETKSGLLGYEYYDSPFTIDGKPYIAHIRVRNTTNGDKYYGHTISEVDQIEIEPETRARETDVPQQSVNKVSDSMQSIAQDNETVNVERDYTENNGKIGDYLTNAINEESKVLGKALGVPYSRRGDFAKDRLRALANSFMRTGEFDADAALAIFDDSWERGQIENREYYDTYKDVKNALQNTKLQLTDEVKANIPEFPQWRKYNHFRVGMTESGGVPIDQKYQELSGKYPNLFPESITDLSEQLMKMAEVSGEIYVSQQSISEIYGDQTGENYRVMRKTFAQRMQEFEKRLKQARDVQVETDAKNASSNTPHTLEFAKQAYQTAKQARREYERALARSSVLLTDLQKRQIQALAAGKLTAEEIPDSAAKRTILELAEIRKKELEAMAPVKAYKEQYRNGLRNTAAKLLEGSYLWKDKSMGLQYSRETMERNVRDMVKEKAQADAIIAEYFTPVHKQEAARTRFKNEMRDKVRAMNLNEAESYAVQFLGEKRAEIAALEEQKMDIRKLRDLNEMRSEVNQFLTSNANNIDLPKVERAIEDFHKIYDELFRQMNEVRIRNGYEPVDYRKNYFPHFLDNKPDTLIGKIGAALGIEIDVKELPVDIAGRTHTFRPGIQWFGNTLQRQGRETGYDAVKGFDKYIEGISNVIYHTDNIQKLRALSNEIRYEGTDIAVQEMIDKIRSDENMSEYEKNARIKDIYEDQPTKLSKFVQELEEYTNILAGKKSRRDRNMEGNIGRKLYSVAQNLNNRVAANMVALNPGSWITNFAPLVQTATQTNPATMARAIKDTVRSYASDDGFANESTFLTNRRGSNPLVVDTLDKISGALSKPMEWIDHFTSDAVTRARYYDNMNRGMDHQDALDEADSYAAGLIGDRSKGALPTIFEAKNPFTKLFTAFQVEVNNQMSWMFKDLPRDERNKSVAMTAWSLLSLFVGSYLANDVYEKLRGRVLFDPMSMVNDAVGDITGYQLPNLVDLAQNAAKGNEALPFKELAETEKTGVTNAIATAAGNAASELPFVGGLLEGGRLPISSALPDVSQLVKIFDPEVSAEKKWNIAGKELLGKPAAYMVLPFGGGQIKKTAEGIATVAAGGSYTVDNEGNRKLQYPVYKENNTSDILPYAQAAVFGKSSLPTAKDWVDSGFKTKSVKFTEAYDYLKAQGIKTQDAYELLEKLQAIKKSDEQSSTELKREMLMADKTLTPEQKTRIDQILISPDKKVNYSSQAAQRTSLASEEMQEKIKKFEAAGGTAEGFYRISDQMHGGSTTAEKKQYYTNQLTPKQKAFVQKLPSGEVSTSWLSRIALYNQDENAKLASAYDDLMIGSRTEKIDYTDVASVYLSLIDSGASSKIGDKYYEIAQPAGVSVEDYMIAYFAQKNVTYQAKTKGAKAAAEKEAIDKALPNLSKKQREALYQAFKG